MENTGDQVAAKIASMSWEELEAVEFEGDGALLFPAAVVKRKADGSTEEIKVMLRVPRSPDLRWAKGQAIKLFAKDGLDPKENKLLFNNCEIVCTLSRCIRNTTPPYEPWEPDPERLERYYDEASLRQVWGKVDELASMINPQEAEMDEATTWLVIAAVAEARNLLPLHVYGSGAQTNWVLFILDRLLTLMASKSSSESSEDSTPG